METIDEITQNIGIEPEVNGLIEEREYSGDPNLEYYNPSVPKEHGDDIYIVQHGNIKEHQAAEPFTTEELLSGIKILTKE
ncbi:hypothetical protein [Nitratifractor sp.]|uniref:hypothetical protein n=1 Tax=Nitratifractor sp. TaxID=2268144 RepID=UPI0025E7979F|nr:hypothetical protein [Nitratifractor sp.]